MNSADPSSPAEQTLQWLQRIVVGLNLCPFAAPAIAADTVDIVVSDATSDEALLTDLVNQMQRLQVTSAADVDTVLIAFTEALADFDAFMDFVAIADGALDALSLRGVIQLASFHPHYRFDGTASDARENFTNRSPWPMLHLLRERSVSRAVAAHPDTADIPARNQRLLREMSASQWRALFLR